MAISTKQVLIADEFWELPEIPGKRLELVAGEVVEAPGATWLHGAIVARLFSLLTAYAVSNRPGQVFGDGMTYLLAREPDTIRIPELSFFPADRLPPGRAPQRYVDAIPALVVEIISPSKRPPICVAAYGITWRRVFRRSGFFGQVSESYRSTPTACRRNNSPPTMRSTAVMCCPASA